VNETMSDPTMGSEKTLREKLSDVIDKLPPDSITLAAVLDLIAREGLLLFCVFLTLPFMVPVSIPGVSTVFGAIILLIGLSVMLDRKPWLPKRFMNRPFPAAKLGAALRKGAVWLQRLERLSHPRLRGLTHGRAVSRLNGFMVVLGAVLLMAPFGLVPLTNTLPGLAILFLAIGILQRDGGCILLGYLTNLATIIYFALLVGTGAFALREITEKILAWFF
jgi:hypothetical protein